MIQATRRRPSPILLYSSSRNQSPQPLSAFEFDGSNSRPASIACSSNTSSPRYIMASRPPTLTEILLDTSPPPWTLSAFMAYLSQNHCMETLEFTLDSQRYAAFYDQFAAEDPPSREGYGRVHAWWERLMRVYIIPCAPREVNIPARVRDNLLAIQSGASPPHPSELSEAGHIIFELMNDSLLVPFLQSVAPLQHLDIAGEDGRSPHFQPNVTIESDGLTDDSDSTSPHTLEPMTPPTTPPTADWNFNTSPGGFQRAVAAHSKSWKKVGAKLGFSRKRSGRRSTPTSSGTDVDGSLSQPSGSTLA